MMFWPGCCCKKTQTLCTEINSSNLILTAPSGTHTLVNFGTTPDDVWTCCFSFTALYTRNNLFAGCPSVAAGLAYIEYRLGNCPPYGTAEDSSRGLVFEIATGLAPCAASPNGFVYSRTAICSGNFLASPIYGMRFWDEDYTYPLASPQYGQIPIEYTSSPFSMSFTLPATDHNGYPVPFPGDYVITKP